jgi:hypothetical protein
MSFLIYQLIMIDIETSFMRMKAKMPTKGSKENDIIWNQTALRGSA